MFWDKWTTLTPLVLNAWGSAWPGALSSSKRSLKSHSVTGKVLSDKALVKPIKKKDCRVQAVFLYDRKTGGWPLSRHFKAQGSVSSFIDGAVLMIHLTVFAQD